MSHAASRRAVVACIDGSAYGMSVCDHAAWIASRIGGGVELLHVAEPHEPARTEARSPAPLRPHPQERTWGDPVVQTAVSRLAEDGADILELFSADGDFAVLAEKLTREASFLVLGRRGRGSEDQPSGLGENVVKLLRRVRTTPVIVVPRVHLPTSKALILFDERRPARGFAEFLASHQSLDGLAFDVGIVTPTPAPAETEEPKPRAEPAVRFGTRFARPRADEVLELYFASECCDLIIMPRSVLLDPPMEPRIFFRRLTRWRVPILFPPEAGV